MCDRAAFVFADAGSEVALVAALTGTPCTLSGDGCYAGLASPKALESVVRERLCEGLTYLDPFTGDPTSARAAIETLGRWRRLIDSNRGFAAIYGVAPWKRVTVDALLWDGGERVRHYYSGGDSPNAGQLALAWVSRTDTAQLADLERRRVKVGEIEDGLIRSTGLGANCVPPLSIVIDTEGPHFDPAKPSELERTLQDAPIDAGLAERGSALRRTLVSAGIGKYGVDADHDAHPLRGNGERRVLVVGQVEDDRSVRCGGAGLTNIELLRRTRKAESDARIVFKPHPDVEAGHRKGHVPDDIALEFADEVDRSASIAAQLASVDAVHVITSLAGFEALLRGREVITHGVPFYAGWGLTRDLGPVPARRTRRLTLDELVAAALLLYPRYLDPVTRLPCEAELLVDRIAAGTALVRSPLVLLRELQGRIKRVAHQLKVVGTPGT